MSTAAAVPADAREAMAMVHAGFAFLARADATAMTGPERAQTLRAMEQADAVATAARTRVLGAFAAGQDYADDGAYNAYSWLKHQTQVTGAAAGDHAAWVKRAGQHPLVQAALAARAVSKSYAREICVWTNRLPAGSRQAADEILLAAAAAGLELDDLHGLAAEMYERSRQDTPDTDPGDDGDGDPGLGFDDRVVTVSTTLGGAGVIRGALTPECAEFVQTVLDSLSGPVSKDDARTADQRYHDALQTSDAFSCQVAVADLLSGCRREFGRGGECDGFVVVLACEQAVVEAAQEAAEQVALGGGVPVPGGCAAVVVGAGAG